MNTTCTPPSRAIEHRWAQKSNTQQRQWQRRRSCIHSYMTTRFTNKRTALVSMLVFLDMNGWTVRASEDDMYEFILCVSAHNLIACNSVPSNEFADAEVASMSEWLSRHIFKNDTISNIRSSLQLSGSHESDSDIPYNLEERLPSFIAKYRKTLDRLAKD